MRILGSFVLVLALIGGWWVYEVGKRFVSSGEKIAGRVTHVRDGDTIEVSGQPVRLSGITCDERGTTLGARGTRAVREIVSGRTLNCDLTGERSYDRMVGRCRLADGRDVGVMLIERGVCGRCNRYDPFRDYAAVQRETGSFSGSFPRYCWAPW